MRSMPGSLGRIGWRLKMKDDIWSVKLEEITPEKLNAIEEHLQNISLKDVTMASLNEIAEKRKLAEQELIAMNTEAQVKAIKAHSLGFSNKDIAEIFGMTTRQATKWLGANNTSPKDDK
jgi:DNA-directed RNA polymerase specialized sigma24 family protein